MSVSFHAVNSSSIIMRLFLDSSSWFVSYGFIFGSLSLPKLTEVSGKDKNLPSVFPVYSYCSTSAVLSLKTLTESIKMTEKITRAIKTTGIANIQILRSMR